MGDSNYWTDLNDNYFMYYVNNEDRVLATVKWSPETRLWRFEDKLFIRETGCKKYVERFVLLNMLDDDEE